MGISFSNCYLDGTVDYHGTAVPIYFQVYQHKGVISENERIKFLGNACNYCPLQGCTLMANREFIGHSWFNHFAELQLNFIIRIQKGMYKNNLLAGRSYTHLQKRATKKGKVSTLIELEGSLFRLWVIHKQDPHTQEPFIYILTNILDKKQVPDLYRLRWKIESLFKHLKTNGYKLEDLRVSDLNKIRLIFAMLTLAFIFAALTALDK